MSESHPFGTESTETIDIIMQATYRSIQRHGYANLTIEKIADEAGLSGSALYNHYEGKEDLLVDFLGQFLEWHFNLLRTEDVADPQADLESFIALLTVGRSNEQSSLSCITDDSSAGAYVELRAQAVHNESFREKFVWEDEVLRNRLTHIIQRGIDDGVFREVDPIPVAEFILTVLEGTLFRHSVVDDSAESTQEVHEQLDEYIHHHLLVSE